MEQSKELFSCLICQGPGRVENPGGVFIKGKYICPNCEEIIIKSKADDENYQKYIHKIKEIWF